MSDGHANDLMTMSDGHAFSTGLVTCLICKKAAKETEASLECDLCHYWFHTKLKVLEQSCRRVQGIAEV